jgi:hypothetical protein
MPPSGSRKDRVFLAWIDKYKGSPLYTQNPSSIPAKDVYSLRSQAVFQGGYRDAR